MEFAGGGQKVTNRGVAGIAFAAGIAANKRSVRSLHHKIVRQS
jgi:hypothetical protein